MPIRLPLAFTASVLLHLILMLTPRYGKLETDVLPTAFQPARDKVIQVSLSRRETAPRNTSPYVTSALADSVVHRYLTVHDKPMTMLLSRQPELIEDTVDDAVGNVDGMGIHGELLLQIFLDRLGRPKSVRVIESSMRRDLEGAVAHRFFLAKYRPGEVNGLPVNSDIILSITLSANPSQPNGP